MMTNCHFHLITLPVRSITIGVLSIVFLRNVIENPRFVRKLKLKCASSHIALSKKSNSANIPQEVPPSEVTVVRI